MDCGCVYDDFVFDRPGGDEMSDDALEDFVVADLEYVVSWLSLSTLRTAQERTYGDEDNITAIN